MAKLPQGILGGLRGKIGSVVGSSWKGISVLRTLALSVANPRTSKQVSQRTSFATIVALASALLSSIIVPLWNRFSVKMSGYNSFVKHNIAAVVDGGVSDFSLIHTSLGKMLGVVITQCKYSVSAQSLSIKLDAAVHDSLQRYTDELYLTVLDNNLKVYYAAKTEAVRSTGDMDILMLLPDTGVYQYYAYFSFSRVDGTVVDTSSSVICVIAV